MYVCMYVCVCTGRESGGVPCFDLAVLLEIDTRSRFLSAESSRVNLHYTTPSSWLPEPSPYLERYVSRVRL